MSKRETDKEKDFRILFEENYSKLYYASLTIVGDEAEARNILVCLTLGKVRLWLSDIQQQLSFYKRSPSKS